MASGFARRVLLSMGATGLFLVLTEGVLALAGLPSTGIYSGDRYTDWRLKPDLQTVVQHGETGREFEIRTSSAGFRDGEIPKGEPWIAALGCSTTFGWGVAAESAWPEQLEGLLGMEVLNAAIPGHSTQQGKAVALELLKEKPDLLVLGWILRDAQRSTKPDKLARAPSGLRATRLYRVLAGSQSKSGVPDQGGVYRVSPSDFNSNLRSVLDVAAQHEVPVVLLAFPMQEEASEHLAGLNSLGTPIWAPQLGSDAFFKDDPIHLNESGHRALAESLVQPLEAILSPPNEEADLALPE